MPAIRCSRQLLGLWLIFTSSFWIASCGLFELDSYDTYNVYIGPIRKTSDAADGQGPGPVGSSKPIPKGPIKVTLENAVLMALENNRAFTVARLDPDVRRTFEGQERAVFDPSLEGEVSGAQTTSERLARSGSGTEQSETDNVSGKIALKEFLPTGTTLALEASSGVAESSLYSDPFQSTRIGLSVTQALLKGRGLRPNLASLRQARLDTRSSQFELRGLAETLVGDVETAYWEYSLAQRQIEIFTASLKLAQQHLSETEERIKVGKLSEIERAASRAEVALRREDLINARSSLATTRLRLLRLLNPPGANLWDREVAMLDQPAVPKVNLEDVKEHVKVAQRMRPEMNQARLGLQRWDLEIVKTRNGLLPKMDLFITLGKSGYADSFGGSLKGIDSSNFDVLAKIRFEYSLGNRDARARHQRAMLSRKQADEALSNLAQLIETDVRIAYIEANRTREQVAATAATRKLQEESLRAETGKFRVGKSTTFLVAQAQRDLVESQNSEIQAVVNHIKALIEFYRLEGSLLERRGVAVPGRSYRTRAFP